MGALLAAVDIDYRTFQTIVYRTDLITDSDVMAAVDARLAVKVARWPAMTQGRPGGYVDRIVSRADRDAVRQRREQQADREFSIWDGGNGLTDVFGRPLSTDAHAVEARLNALADKVCADDPCTRKQRRADARSASPMRLDRRAQHSSWAASAARIASASASHRRVEPSMSVTSPDGPRPCANPRYPRLVSMARSGS